MAEDVGGLNTQSEIAWLTVYGLRNFDAYGRIALHGNSSGHLGQQLGALPLCLTNGTSNLRAES